jgi:hypothetical protein
MVMVAVFDDIKTKPYCAWFAEFGLYMVERATACWMVVAEVMACPVRAIAQLTLAWVTPERVKSRIFEIGPLVSLLSAVIAMVGVPELVEVLSVARDRVTADGVAYEAAFVPPTVKVYVAVAAALVVDEVVAKTKEAVFEVVFSVIEAGVKVKLVFPDGATGVMVIPLYGGIPETLNVSGAK